MLHAAGGIPKDISAKGLSFAIVGSRFNEELTDSLVHSAKQQFLDLGGLEKDITVIRVPGAYEIPLAVQALLHNKQVDAVVVVGVIIEGATPHFDKLCSDITDKISMLSLEFEVPIGFGVVMARNMQQAVERASNDSSNKGKEAALACIEMAGLLSKLREA
jgi:6,7-dimethyl-8-ribityllumazine synthase